MAEIIPVNTTLELRAAEEGHVPALHQLVLKNKAWLQQSLDWPQYVTSQDETRKHVQGNCVRHFFVGRRVQIVLSLPFLVHPK